MSRMFRLFKWLLYAAIFFTFFAFALNNQQDATLRFFFGAQWRMPMALVVLTAFTAGLVAGILAMVPRWWRHRRVAIKLAPQSTPPLSPALNPGLGAVAAIPEHGH